MPIFLCDECQKTHIASPDDEFCNLYCYHTFLEIKKQEIRDVKKHVKLNKNGQKIVLIEK